MSRPNQSPRPITKATGKAKTNLKVKTNYKAKANRKIRLRPIP
jgi:hypothetical protein